jgi:hypothetical protein
MSQFPGEPARQYHALADDKRVRGRCFMYVLKAECALSAKVRSNAVDFTNGLFKP